MANHKALPGYKSRVTKRGIRVVEIDAWSDPARDESWLAEAKRRLSAADYQREVLRSWETVQGDAYYGEAAKIGRERYVFELLKLIRQPVIRGWDFGLRHPVCLAVGTRVLTADLRWVPAETLAVGSQIVAFDEEPGGGSGNARRWRRGEILSTQVATKPSMRVTLDDGTRFTCSVDHRFLATVRSHTDGRAWRNDWVLASEIRPGTRLPRFFRPWDDPADYEAGWVGGFYDGEGSLSLRPGGDLSVSVSQTKNGLMDRLARTLDIDRFSVGRWSIAEKRSNQQDTERLVINGGWNETLRFLGTYRPDRLLAKFQRLFEHGPHMRKIDTATVVSIVPTFDTAVVVMETTTRTYVAEGFGHHNCIWSQYAPESDRWFTLREWHPKTEKGAQGIAAHHFRDVCRWLSGEIGYDELLDETSRGWADLHLELAGAGQAPMPPWFPRGTEFFDFSGHEANTPQSISAKDPRDATLADVWRAGGINLATQYGKVKARCDVLRRLLFPRADGWPGIVVSQHCPGVLAMLMGGLVFKRATPLRPRPEDPKKDGYYDDINDALTYGIVAVVPPNPPRRDLPAEDQYIPWSTR